MVAHAATVRAVTSFAAKEAVHAHIHVEWEYDAKLDQCMTLLRAHLPGDMASHRTLSKVSAADLVLSVEAAELQSSLVVLLSQLHPSDAIACMRAMFQYHQTCSPPHNSGRATTLEALVYTCALHIAAYTPSAKGPLKQRLDSLGTSSNCHILQRAIAALTASDTCLTAHTSQPPPCPHVVDQLLRSMPSVSVDTCWLQDLASACIACCDHHQCIPSEYEYFSVEETLLQATAATSSETLPPSDLATIEPATSPSSARDIPAGIEDSEDDDWHAEPIVAQDQVHQTFARLLGSASWSRANIEWLQAYLDRIDDVHVLAIHVGWVIHRSSAAMEPSAAPSQAMQTLMNFVTPSTPPHAFLRAGAFDPRGVVHALVAHGLHTRETRPLFLRVLSMLAPFVQESLVGVVTAAFSSQGIAAWQPAAEWGRLLVQSELLPADAFCMACVLPHLQTTSSSDESLNGWLLAHALLVSSTTTKPPSSLLLTDQSTIATILEVGVCELRRIWSISPRERHVEDRLTCYEHTHVVLATVEVLLATAAPPTLERVDLTDFDDVRLHVLMHPSKPDLPWAAALEANALEWSPHVVDIVWGALLGNQASVAALPRVQTSIKTSHNDIPWEVAVAAFCLHVIAPHTNAVQFRRLTAEVLPQLAPSLPPAGALVVPSDDQDQEKLAFEWTWLLWTVRCAAMGLHATQPATSVRALAWAVEAVLAHQESAAAHYLVCFGAVVVVLNGSFSTPSMAEQLKVLARTILSRAAKANAPTDSFTTLYLRFCIDQVEDAGLRQALHRQLPLKKP